MTWSGATSRSGGTASAQVGRAFGQRVRKTQPEGGASGLGGRVGAGSDAAPYSESTSGWVTLLDTLYFHCIVRFMSHLLHDGASALAETEAKLKALASDAIAQNEWDAVSTLAAWARGLREILDGARANGTDLAPPARFPGVPVTAVVPPARPETTAERPGSGSVTPPRRTTPRTTEPAPPVPKKVVRPSAVRKGVGYPRFFREGDALVKVGWSKKGKSEYEHRAPREMLDQIIATIRDLSRARSRFTVEEILASIAAKGADLPSYQTYLCIAWMRENGLLEQHGRQGYSVAQPTQLSDEMARAWSATATR